MKLGALAGGICRVCGSDTYGADIGCGCQIMYKRAIWIALKNHEDLSLEYNYGMEMKAIMDKYKEIYDASFEKHNGDINKMFRSEFNRKFFPSVIEFYNKKGYVSKKQLEIVKNKLFGYNPYERDEFYDDLKIKKESFINSFKAEYDGEIIVIARNLWKVKKENKE